MVLLFAFFFSDEVQASGLKGKAALQIEKVNVPVLFVIKDMHPSPFERISLRSASASRCSHVLKQVVSGNSSWQTLLLTNYSYGVKLNRIYIIAKSHYLSHIYPTHNFW